MEFAFGRAQSRHVSNWPNWQLSIVVKGIQNASDSTVKCPCLTATYYVCSKWTRDTEQLTRVCA